MSARRILLSAGAISAVLAAAGAWMGELVLVVAFAMATLIAWLLAVLQRPRRGANGRADAERALQALQELVTSNQAAKKPLTAWVVAGGYVGRLKALRSHLRPEECVDIATCMAALADATFKGPRGRKHVTYDVIARMLDAFEDAAPMSPPEGKLSQTLAGHLWLEGHAATELGAFVQNCRRGLRDGEGAKSFDPPVFKRRVLAGAH